MSPDRILSRRRTEARNRIMFKTGDLVVFRLTRHSTHPPHAAKHVDPSTRGEGYSYVVDKFWMVAGTVSERAVRVRTRRGKEFEIDVRDPRLRRASWTEQLIRRRRFPPVPRRGGRHVVWSKLLRTFFARRSFDNVAAGRPSGRMGTWDSPQP
jgi:hypothetical protein